MSLLSVHQKQPSDILMRSHQNSRQKRKIVIAQLLLLAIVAHDKQPEILSLRLDLVLVHHQRDDVLS